ncbi:hypothetical protein VNO78_22440 [Psophocarpus tetragonolobus]|uniref:Uncharacterized protein n=1 Tax=Psophocarpus tetragonolobus TaxID=3891 RepID=A0AAN9S1V1_PSOTE
MDLRMARAQNTSLLGSSFIWRSIIKARDALKSGFQFQLENGNASMCFNGKSGVVGIFEYQRLANTSMLCIVQKPNQGSVGLKTNSTVINSKAGCVGNSISNQFILAISLIQTGDCRFHPYGAFISTIRYTLGRNWIVSQNETFVQTFLPQV